MEEENPNDLAGHRLAHWIHTASGEKARINIMRCRPFDVVICLWQILVPKSLNVLEGWQLDSNNDYQAKFLCEEKGGTKTRGAPMKDYFTGTKTLLYQN